MAQSEANPEVLVQQGLQLYSRGQLDQALDVWRSALRLDPNFARAQEYISYVEANRAALEATFSGSGATSEAVPSAEPAAQRQQRVTKHDHSLGLDDSMLRQTNPGTEMNDDSIPVNIDDAIDMTDAVEIDMDDYGSESAVPLESNAGPMLAFEVDSVEPEPQRSAADSFPEPPTVNLPNWSDSDAVKRSGEVGASSGGDELNWREEPTLLSANDGFPGQERSVDEPQPIFGGAAAGGPLSEEVVSEMSGPTTKFNVREDEPRLRRQTKPMTVSDLKALDGGASKEDNTPRLEVMDGGSVPENEEFNPEELTPVGTIIPEPTLSVEQDPAHAEPDTAIRGAGAADALDGPFVDFVPNEPTPASLHDQQPRQALDTAQGANSEDLLAAAEGLFQNQDFEQSFELCEKVLKEKPDDEKAKGLRVQLCERLLPLYERRLGDLGKVPVVQMPEHAVVWHKLDHRAGFLLSRIDGMLSYDDVLDICGMPRFDACRILVQLIEKEVIAAAT